MYNFADVYQYTAHIDILYISFFLTKNRMYTESGSL